MSDELREPLDTEGKARAILDVHQRWEDDEGSGFGAAMTLTQLCEVYGVEISRGFLTLTATLTAKDAEIEALREVRGRDAWHSAYAEEIATLKMEIERLDTGWAEAFVVWMDEKRRLVAERDALLAVILAVRADHAQTPRDVTNRKGLDDCRICDLVDPFATLTPTTPGDEHG